jgi:hypothetical protein
LPQRLEVGSVVVRTVRVDAHDAAVRVEPHLAQRPTGGGAVCRRDTIL